MSSEPAASAAAPAPAAASAPSPSGLAGRAESVPLAPTFLILGAQKCGTTWLARALARQAGVFMPADKELHYFTRFYDKGADWYRGRFAPGIARGARALGEATPNYLAVTCTEYRDVARRIADHGGDLRFVAIVRNPIQRAISAYMHHVARGRFSPFQTPEEHFEEALDGRESYGVLRMGLYGAQLSEYFHRFGPDRFRVYVHEEMRARPQQVVREVLGHIGLPGVEPVGPFEEKANVSLKSRAAARAACVLSAWMKSDEVRFRYGAVTREAARLVDVVGRGPRLELAPRTRARLVEYFREDARVLQKLLGRKEPIWPELSA